MIQGEMLKAVPNTSDRTRAELAQRQCVVADESRTHLYTSTFAPKKCSMSRRQRALLPRPQA